MYTSGVYCIKNTVNGKIYVGISTNLKHRIKKHFHTLRRGNHHNSHLQKSADFYGLDCFTVEIVEFVEESDLLIKENYYQQLYKSTDSNFGYNVFLTDINGKIRHSEESKQKISAGNKGKPKSEETKVKLSMANLGSPGIPHTEKHKIYISKCLKGKPKSEEHKKNLSLAKIGKPSPMKGIRLGPMHSDQTKKNWSMTRKGSLNPRSVKIIDSSGNIYLTIKEACEKLNKCRTTIEKYIKSGALRRV